MKGHIMPKWISNYDGERHEEVKSLPIWFKVACAVLFLAFCGAVIARAMG